MKVSLVAEKLKLECLHEGNGDREVRGVYVGVLLSRVMGKASSEYAWITIMSNVNVAAVASLADAACVILAEDVRPDAQLADKLGMLDMPVYTTPMAAYDIAWRIHGILAE